MTLPKTEVSAREVIAARLRQYRITNADHLAGDLLKALKSSGLAIVPVEPTEAMIVAGARASDMDVIGRFGVSTAYRAMLSSSQTTERK